MTHRAGLTVTLLAALALAFLGGANAANAGALTVNSTASSGPMTLRHAIESANGNPGADTINFDPTVFPPGSPATILLNDPLPEINGSSPVIIDGSDAGVIVDGSQLDGAESGLMVTGGSVSGVSILGIQVQNFPGSGIDVCGGGLPGCTGNISTLALNGITALDNGQMGIRVRGDVVQTVDVEGCDLRNNNYGVFFHSGTDLAGVTVETCRADSNANTGVYAESYETIDDFGLVNSSVSRNGSLGAYLDSVEETRDPLIDNVQAIDNGLLGIGFSAAQPLSGLVFTDSAVEGNGGVGNGVGTEVLAFQVLDSTITGNSFSYNDASNKFGGVGLQIYSQFEDPSNVKVMDNTVVGNVGRGIAFFTDTPGNLISDLNVISGNEVSGNSSDGVYIEDSERVTITHNRISGNDGIGINLAGGEGESNDGVTPNDIGDGDGGANTLLNYPVLNGISGSSLVGTACAFCTVEVYRSDDDPTGHGEGPVFIGETEAPDGAFLLPLCGVGEGDTVTATATDQSGDTSEFSLNYAVPIDTEPCAGTLQGDVNCDGAIDGQDSLLIAVFSSGLSADAPGCFDLGAGSPRFGDLNCDGVVDARDLLGPLAYQADVPFPQGNGCTDVGSPL